MERYLLGELDADERAAFEEHAFACDECASAISDGIALIDNGRALVEAQRRFRPEERRRGRLLTWIPSAVAAALAVVVGVQYFQPARQTLPAIQVLHGYSLDQSRGESVPRVRAGEPAVLYITIDDPSPHVRYAGELRDASDHVRRSFSITREQTKDTIPIALLRPLPAGSYHLVVYGVRADGNRDAEVGRYPFEVGP